MKLSTVLSSTDLLSIGPVSGWTDIFYDTLKMSRLQSAVQVNKLITLFNDSPKFTFLLQVNYLIEQEHHLHVEPFFSSACLA